MLLFELIFGFKLVKIIGAKGWGGVGGGGGEFKFFRTKIQSQA